MVKVTHNAYATGIGCPYGKTYTSMILEFNGVGTEFVVDVVMIAFGVKVKVKVT
jgi:hypothetical protein